MGRQFRSPRLGAGQTMVGSPVNGPTSVNAVIPNYGITDITTWAAGDYVLAPPVEGVRKTFVTVTGTSVARVIRGSTGVSVKIGTTAHTQLVTGASTIGMCIVLLGYNSTQWLIESQFPAATTGAAITSATS